MAEKYQNQIWQWYGEPAEDDDDDESDGIADLFDDAIAKQIAERRAAEDAER